MASENIPPSSKSSDYSEIHDVPIIPPQPVARKEYKEVVPDISTVSDVVDNGSQLQNFDSNFLGPQIKSKYLHYLSELKEDRDSKNNTLFPVPNTVLTRNINRPSHQQQFGINTCVSKTFDSTTERIYAALDHNGALPYFNPECQNCVINHAVLANKRYNGQYILPKNSASILLAVDNEQSDKDIRCKCGDEVTSIEACYKAMPSNISGSSNHKSISHSKDQHSELRKSLSDCKRPVSSDFKLDESKKVEETCEKEAVDRNIFKNENILCPTCFKRPCKCDFSAKKCFANPNAPYELSSILEYLKRQDEKISSIHEKVSNFLSQHASCLINQPAQGNEISYATEKDIPYILNILKAYGDKIGELQDQINLLKSSEHTTSANCNKIGESILNQAQTVNCVITETCNKDIQCPYFHNAVCQEQRQKVTKTSTSTMTSFIIENNDKHLYHKQMAVVSNKTEKKESSCLSNKCDSTTTKKHSDEENVNCNSQQRKSHKFAKGSPGTNGKKNLSSNSSSNTPDFSDNQVFKPSHKSEKKSKRASTRHKIIDEENFNDKAMKDNGVEEEKNSPAVKTVALKSHSRSSKQKLRNSSSPKVADMAIQKDLRNKKMIRQISTSSSSTDTEYDSPKHREKVFDKKELDSEESTFVSKYGLRSENLSMATRRYLDNYGLKKTRQSN